MRKKLASRPSSRSSALLALLVLLLAAACRREQRTLVNSPRAADSPVGVVRLSELQPGQKLPDVRVRNGAEERAFDLNEGKRLYGQMNCVGCHAHGGGGIGPPLMDQYWIYGSDAENIRATILEGRPNGMPSYAGKLKDYQVWQLVAYVRSLSGLVPKFAAPSRSDHMVTKNAEQSVKQDTPQEKELPPEPQQ
jgi:cytochrome c oxidase cbb3-type subunit 3